MNKVLREPGVKTWAARCVAVRAGWDETGADAWAVELVLPYDLSGALDALEITLGDEAASIGWRLRPLSNE